MQSNNIFQPVAIYQAAEIQNLKIGKLTVSAETLAAQKVTMVMINVIERSFAAHKSKFSDFDNLIKTIRTAMSGRYLSSIEIFGFHKSSRVLSLKISIDWDTLKILAVGANFKPLNPKLSPLAQVDEAISVIISLLAHEVANRKIDHFRSIFATLHSTKAEEEKRYKDCGFSYLSESESQDVENFRKHAIGHSVSSEDVPGAVFRVLYVDSPIKENAPSIFDRLNAFFRKL